MADPHASDCAMHNGPALDPGPCDCGPVATDDYSEAAVIARLVEEGIAETALPTKELLAIRETALGHAKDIFSTSDVETDDIIALAKDIEAYFVR